MTSMPLHKQPLSQVSQPSQLAPQRSHLIHIKLGKDNTPIKRGPHSVGAGAAWYGVGAFMAAR